MDAEKLAADYTAAWNSGDPAAVAAFHTPESGITINRGEPSDGLDAITEMAAGFHAAVPDLHLTCDGVRSTGDHVIYLWTFTGHDSETKNPLKVAGWEEWNLNAEGKITYSLGWFDADDYARQIAGD